MISFDNRFVRELPADPEKRNFIRQVSSSAYSFCEPQKVSKAKTVCVNQALAKSCGFDSSFIQSQKFAETFSGNSELEGMQPYAMCYGGHQFGNWAGQLGDGRAINLGEINTKEGYKTLQLKGAGMTPYSRHADGLAVLRSSIREYLCSEAMHHLRIPTTRALSLVLTGEEVERDMFYDGNPEFEPGAIVCRVSPSFIRFGSFEIFSARNDVESLAKIADFCIRNDFPELNLDTVQNPEQRYLQWFNEIVQRSCDMVVHWQRVGFVHGVMNTDNMSILGLTIDYGPYGWIDDFDPHWTPNTTDLPGRRYCFGNQPKIVHWNLFQLAQALVPLIKDTDALQAILDGFMSLFEQKFLSMMASKLGLLTVDKEFVVQLEEILHQGNVDMTMFYRSLADFDASHNVDYFQAVFYQQETLSEDYKNKFQQWLDEYQARIKNEQQDYKLRKETMNQVNPWFVLRNYLTQQAIEAAEQGDYSMLHDLEKALETPYEMQTRFKKFGEKRPDWAKNKAGCSMLSCSS